MIPTESEWDEGGEEAATNEEIAPFVCGTPYVMFSRESMRDDAVMLRETYDRDPSAWGFLGAAIFAKYRSAFDCAMLELWHAIEVTRVGPPVALPGDTWASRIEALDRALDHLEQKAGCALAARAELSALLQVEPVLDAAAAVAAANRIASGVPPWPETAPPPGAAPLLDRLQALAEGLDAACTEVERVVREGAR